MIRQALLAGVAVGACAALASAAPPSVYADQRFLAPLDDGLHAFYARRFAAAESAFGEALAAVPDDSLALAFYDAAAQQLPGELERVTQRAQAAVDRAPNDPIAHLHLGYAELVASIGGRDRPLAARDQLERAAALAPLRAAAHVGLGLLRYRERSIDRAKQEFLAAARADPNDVLAREYLGEIYQVDLHDPERALGYLTVIANEVPDYADALFHIGSVLYDLKQPAAATRFLERAIALDPDATGEAGRYGYTLLARIAIDGRRYADARRWLERAVAVGADASYAKTLLAEIERDHHER
ncbi:MAG: tetratricopeptide repeat protein [Vulcanimicrobiaceae bacterium]